MNKEQNQQSLSLSSKISFMATTMDLASTKWLSELEMEEYGVIDTYLMNSFVEDHTLPQSFPSINIINHNESSCDVTEEKPLKVLKSLHIPSKLSSSSSLSLPHPPSKRQPSTQILSFEKNGSNMNHSTNYLKYPIFTSMEEAASPEKTLKVEVDRSVTRGNHRGTKRAHILTRSQSNGQDHIIAERKRREKLTQRFVALSAVLPGLKKMDKASVLNDAIKQIKYLQERVKEFEENKKSSMESVVLMKKSSLILDEESSFHYKSNDSNSPLPEIEVRISDKDVMIKILCENQKGHMIKILSEIENLHLGITNSNVLPFGSTLDITVIARKGRDFHMKIIDIVKNLRLALSKFM